MTGNTNAGAVITGMGQYSTRAVGRVVMEGGIVATVDLGPLASTSGPKLGGLVGNDVLRQQPFALDFRAATLTLYKPTAFRPPAAARM